jgi:hypothetical protein
MKILNRSILAVLATALFLLPAGAAHAFVNPIVDFGSGYAVEDARVVDDHTSTAGDTLTIVGHVVQFQDPFDDLDANDPTVEYTYVYSGLISAGTVVSGSGMFAVYDTDYAGGILRIYEDPAQNSDFANPATFADGTMILEASLSNFRLTTLAINCSGNQSGSFQFTGGTLFDRVSAGGIGYEGIIAGLFSVCSSLVPSAQQTQGYFGLSDSKLDIDPPTPTRKSSWSRIKTQY